MATPANPNVAPERYNPFWFRFLEILPGATVWSAFTVPFLVSINHPLSVTIFILIFDSYWVVNAFSYAQLMLRGFLGLRANMARNWQAQLDATLALSPEEFAKEQFIDWRELYHVVILATYRESQEILEDSIRSVINADFPKDRIVFVLATEGRAADTARPIGAALQKKYAKEFKSFLVTEHPDDIVGEVKAKGANVTWAARKVTAEMERLGVPFDRVIVSTADADSRFHKAFFLCLAYMYATVPDRINCAFQPIPMYFNNIWDTPAFSRIMAFGTTFWNMIESIRDYRMITFATHAMSLRTLVDIDYWCTTIVNEDSRQFFRAWFHYDGKFRSIPLFMPIYMDAVHVGNIPGTIRNLYLQQQRWAYGVEHFPYIVLESLRRPHIPLMDRINRIWRAFQGAFSWATSSFITGVVGWIPIALNPQFRTQVPVANFVVITKVLLSCTWVGLLLSAFIMLMILPPPPKGKRHIFLFMISQWLAVPFLSMFISIPGLDAQTRLMFGKYLGFRVTEKTPVGTAKAPLLPVHAGKN
jgi:hypothetical protein